MTEKTRVIYIARDGKEFHSASRCLEYEKTLCSYSMYTENCDITHDPGEAIFVHIPDHTAARDFIQLCEKEAVPHDGIEEGGRPGWFWWINRHGYERLNPKIAEVMTALVNDMNECEDA